MNKKYIDMVKEQVEQYMRNNDNHEYISMYFDNYVKKERKSRANPNPEEKQILDFSMHIIVDGYSGGNYMGDQPEYFHGFDGIQPDLKELGYDILSVIEEENLKSNGEPISFLRARSLLTNCISTEHKDEVEIYGNSKRYIEVKFDFKNLYDNLLEKGLIIEQPEVKKTKTRDMI